MYGNLTFRGRLDGLSMEGILGETTAALASCLSDFFFSVFFFFFLATWLLESRLSLGEVEEEDKEIGEEGERSTLESTWCFSGRGDGCIVAGTLEITEVENNQIGNPIVNPGRDNVAIQGAPIFPKIGKGLGIPPEGIP